MLTEEIKKIFNFIETQKSLPKKTIKEITNIIKYRAGYTIEPEILQKLWENYYKNSRRK